MRMMARIGGRYIIVPKLVGLLLVLVALMFFVGATIDLVMSWDRIKDVKQCIEGAVASEDTSAYQICAIKALAAGIYPYADGINVMDKWGIMLQKAAVWVFWVLVLVIAFVIYQTGKVLEFEEVYETAVTAKEEKAEKTKKTRRGRKRKKS